MSPLRERLAFAATLAVLVAGFFWESLFAGKVLSPADVVYAQASFQNSAHGANYEPRNRLLIDPVLQFQPWLEFNRTELRAGRLPLWNPYAGCGAPHLANGQSAVFDPFHLIAYIGELPSSYSVMAAARLWVAGFGMFLLAWRFGLGLWGRWFAGLAFPFTGFLIVWLQYPVTGVAIWFPWLVLLTDITLKRPSAWSIALLSLVTGALLLAGHIQTSAHVLLAGGLYACWQSWNSITALGASVWDKLRTERMANREIDSPIAAQSIAAWAAGIALGLAIGAVAIIPLGVYLTRSPVWQDRERARPGAFELSRPRLLDAACTAFPYLYGSQRRGHPNLAKPLGVHNINESAGAFAGLATLVWLAPIGLGSRNRRARFLAMLACAGALVAFQIPPFVNLTRVIPVLDVADNRRLALWVSFALVLLGGMGLDRLFAWRPGRAMIVWMSGWLLAAVAFVALYAIVPHFEQSLRARAVAHQRAQIAKSAGLSASELALRVDRQVRQVLDFTPLYLAFAAAQLSVLSILAAALARGVIKPNAARVIAIALVLGDLGFFGYGFNPAIARGDERPMSPVISYLQREAAPPARVLAMGAELPPNMLTRYGLSDVRNYDSVELTRSLAWFSPLYEQEASQTSRRAITWDGVIRAKEELRAANVTAIVGATRPPPHEFDRIDRVGRIWIARLDAKKPRFTREAPGQIEVLGVPSSSSRLVISETYDPGWRAEIDGAPASVEAECEAFLAVCVPQGSRRLRLIYDPPEVRWAVRVSVIALASAVAGIIFAILKKARRKTFRRAWSARNDRVRIDLRDLRRFSSPASHGNEGRDADGPLHV
jgi:hypothetical protein